MTSPPRVVTHVSRILEFMSIAGKTEGVLPSMSARAVTRFFSLIATFALILHVAPVAAVEPEGESIGANVGGGWGFNKTERCVMGKINKVRRNKGLSALRADKQVGVVARRHARSMAANYSVFHDYNMHKEITHWKSLGQNSGAAGSCKRVFWAFMRSAGHRSNILGTWRHMGVGVEKRGGRVFVQQVFEWRRDPGNIYRYP